MKKINYYFAILFVSLLFTSCLVDDEAPSDNNDTGPNLAGFSDASANLGGIANGDTYTFDLRVQVKGPGITMMNEDVTMTVAPDPSSTAIEGVNFEFPSSSITLSKSNNYLGFLPITMLTEGIVAPLAESPVLYLAVTSASGGNVVNNGQLLRVNFNYLCNSALAGDYAVEMHYINPNFGTDTWHYGNDTVNETGSGTYRTDRVGHWEIDGGPGAIGGTPGFDFFDVCNEITVPAQNLVELYSNIVEGRPGENYVDPDTGVIEFGYDITASYARSYWATYTPLF